MYPPNTLTISVAMAVDGTQVLCLAGVLDMATAPEFIDALTATVRSGGTSEIMVDLEALTFLDAAGLTAFVRAHALARRSGRTLLARNPRDEVDTVLRITDVADLLQIADTGSSTEALSGFTGTQKMMT
jgi:anti-sigma B factor antagonist